MKKYVKPITECAEGTLTMPLMLSLIDEVGDGQLTNTFEFEENEDNDDSHVWKDKLNIGY